MLKSANAARNVQPSPSSPVPALASNTMSVQIKPKTLGVAEGVLHQRPPPRWATPQAEATEHEEQALEGSGSRPSEACTARAMVNARSFSIGGRARRSCRPEAKKDGSATGVR